MSVETGPFLFGTPEDYARGKAQAFPAEGGPVILAVDVPDDIVQRAVNTWFPLSQGLIQFDVGAGIEELIASGLTRERRSLSSTSRLGADAISRMRSRRD